MKTMITVKSKEIQSMGDGFIECNNTCQHIGEELTIIPCGVMKELKIKVENKKTEEEKKDNNMKFNLIPNLIFTNDRGETFRVETQEAVIRIGNSVLLKHTIDIIDKLDKIFEGAKQVIVKLEYHTLDENEQSLGITTRQVYVKTYEVREYYNTKKDKNDMIYLFSWEGCLGNEVKELLEEYRHRQMLESLNSYRTCDEDSCFGVKRFSEMLSK